MTKDKIDHKWPGWRTEYILNPFPEFMAILRQRLNLKLDDYEASVKQVNGNLVLVIDETTVDEVKKKVKAKDITHEITISET